MPEHSPTRLNTMRLLTSNNRRSAAGFSIVELMVSIGIIGLLIGISFPFISAMTTGSRVEAGLNIVGMSSDVARQWVQAESWADDGIANATNPSGESYSGTAAIYCPTGEIRIVSNNRFAKDTGSNFLEGAGSTTNGYKDLPQVDYIRIPVDVGIAGIERTGSGATAIRFIAPPFAIAFNELGQLNYGDTSGYIYYDGDGDNEYDLTTAGERPSGYDPRDWGDDRDAASDYTSELSLKLPFEAIECVPGVVVFDFEKYEAAGFDFDGGSVTLSSNEGQWLQDNGETIFFSPHTGAALRDEQE